jgi:hypothetical protein
MSEDTSKALFDELRQQFKGDVEARRKRRRIVLWVIASPFIAFAAFFVVFVISEETSSTQSWASTFGASVSECQKAFAVMDTPERGHCRKRVPKVKYLNTTYPFALAAQIAKLKLDYEEALRPPPVSANKPPAVSAPQQMPPTFGGPPGPQKVIEKLHVPSQ